jgi:hypothetical protein
MNRAKKVSWLCLVLAAGCKPAYCADTCRHAYDGECDDGRPGAATGLCARGTDCSDCGPNPDVQLAADITSPPAPVPAPGRAIRGEIPTPPSGGGCVCDADAYCVGTGGVEVCADQESRSGVATPCATSSMSCPSGPDIEYQCGDGDRGIGCYAIDNEYCETVGECRPETRNAGMPIEHCGRMPTFIGHFSTHENYVRLSFDVSECETWYQVGSARASCGACADACWVFLNDGPNPCEMDQGPDPGDFDCGDGTYVPPSRVCNSASDCANGRDESSSTCSSESSCCTATRGCPGESATSCATSCCCCPAGQRCCTDWSRGCCPA